MGGKLLYFSIIILTNRENQWILLKGEFSSSNYLINDYASVLWCIILKQKRKLSYTKKTWLYSTSPPWDGSAVHLGSRCRPVVSEWSVGMGVMPGAGRRQAQQGWVLWSRPGPHWLDHRSTRGGCRPVTSAWIKALYSLYIAFYRGVLLVFNLQESAIIVM